MQDGITGYSFYDFSADGLFNAIQRATYTYNTDRESWQRIQANGHDHGTSTYDWQNVPVFNVGSPYYTSYNPDGRGHYTVFRITNDTLYAFDVSWDPNAPTSIVGPDRWSRIVPLS